MFAGMQIALTSRPPRTIVLLALQAGFIYAARRGTEIDVPSR